MTTVVLRYIKEKISGTDDCVMSLMDSIAVIAHTNTDLNQRRRELIRPADLKKQYQRLCSEPEELSTFLLRKDLSQQVKNINAANWVGQKLSGYAWKSSVMLVYIHHFRVCLCH